jgi:hypothetical protein
MEGFYWEACDRHFLEGMLMETLLAILGDIFYHFMEFWHGQNPNSFLSPCICLVEMVHLLFWV